MQTYLALFCPALVCSALVCGALLGCGPSPSLATAPTQPGIEPLWSATVPSQQVASAHGVRGAGRDHQLKRDVAQLLGQLAGRELHALRPIEAHWATREQAIKRLSANTKREVPEQVLRANGELLRIFGLIPEDYAFVAGIEALLKDNVAGFYDQFEKRLFVVADLNQNQYAETLTHELVHALQDQHFDLRGLLRYQNGAGDRIASKHALAEGDALSATYDAAGVLMEADELRAIMRDALREKRVPEVLRNALAAPYSEGFAFVETMKRSGGWAAVNRAFATIETTEQLLHPERYLRGEQAIAVAPLSAPDESWQLVDTDAAGELTMRLIFEQWSDAITAIGAAEGWGGDRFVVVERAGRYAVAWLMIFDTQKDADEAASLLSAAFPTCGKNGVSHKRRGRWLAIAGGALGGTDVCEGSQSWLTELLAF